MAAVVISGLAGQTAKFAIAGRVVLPGDRTQAGMPVRVVRVDKGEDADFTERDTVVTGADGRFQTKGLPQGKYSICVAVDPSMGVVDPCEWGAVARELNAASGRNETIRLEAGTRVVFRLGDPERKLRHPRELGGDRALALVGAFDANGFFHLAKITGVSEDEQVWMLTVPKGRNYTLHVSGAGMTFGGKAQVSDGLTLEGKDMSEMEVKAVVEGKR